MRTRWLAVLGALLVLSGCGLTFADVVPGGPTLAQKTFATEPEAELAQAIDDDDATRIDRELAAGANPNAVGTEQLTMLQFAVRRNSVVGVEKLLAARVDPDTVGTSGRTALHLAVLQDDERLTELLLGAGANVNAQARGLRDTPLYVSASSRKPSVVKRLLAAGADPLAVTTLKETALFPAARVNSGDVIVALLDGGVDPRAETGRGDTFQDLYFGYDKSILNERALAERQAVADWLRARNIEVDPRA